MKRIAEFLRRFRSVGLLLAAMACGGLAMFGARGYISEQIAIERERLVPKRDEIEVVVAKRALRRGEPVGPETMAVRRVPREFVPGTAVTPDRFDGFSGAHLSSAMRSGELLLQTAIEGADASSFSSKLRPGVRALTISVDEVNSLSGMLQPGDRIDLHLSVRPPQRPGGAGGAGPGAELTVPLLQDILVLATGRQVRPAADEAVASRHYTSITIEATPTQAQRLIVAQRGGRLTALLRNREDRAAVAQRSLDINSLLDMPVAVSRGPRTFPEIIVGGRGPLQQGVSLAAGLPNASGNSPVATWLGLANAVGMPVGGPGPLVTPAADITQAGKGQGPPGAVVTSVPPGGASTPQAASVVPATLPTADAR